jgi:WD40 repeat protein
VTSIAFSPDGRLLVSAGTNELANVWDVATGKRIRSLSHPFAVDGVSFNGDGRLLLTRARDVRVWDVADGRLVSLLDQRGDINVARFSPDGSQVLTGGRDDLAVIWNTQTGEPVQTLRGHVADVRDVAWSPRGSGKSRTVTSSRSSRAT